jgi:septal ring factor EnvC (AmiA/AmiB activator)
LTSSEPNSPTVTSPGYTITSEKQDSDLKSVLTRMIEDFKKNINNSLKELQENTIKQAKEMNKTIKDLKMEIETIKKSQSETTMELQNLEKRSGVIDANIINRIQEIGERIYGAKNIENIGTTVKERAKYIKFLT